MERISSMFFCVSILAYYIPKVFKAKRKCYLKAHIILGSISVVSMIGALIQKIGQADFIKYIGFTAIMIAIGLTGAFMKRNYKLYRILHIVFTVLFFVYLPIAIKML